MSKKTKQSREIFKRRRVEPKTLNQAEYIKALRTKDLTICLGPAGSGKTHVAIGMAMNLLDANKFEKILIARPAVEAGESLGYLPGDQDKKLDPYVRPIFDELEYYSSYTEIATLKNNRTLEIVPIAFMRGRTFKNAFIIIDECQNATYPQLEMAISRLGTGSRMVLTGDVTQSDLRKTDRGALQFAFDLFKKELRNEVACIKLSVEDIVRHELVGKVLQIWQNSLDNYKKDGKIVVT